MVKRLSSGLLPVVFAAILFLVAAGLKLPAMANDNLPGDLDQYRIVGLFNSVTSSPFFGRMCNTQLLNVTATSVNTLRNPSVEFIDQITVEPVPAAKQEPVLKPVELKMNKELPMSKDAPPVLNRQYLLLNVSRGATFRVPW